MAQPSERCTARPPQDAPPPLRPSEDEVAIRRATKTKIAAKYGLDNWDQAPKEALREYHCFLKSRMETLQ